MSIYTQIAKNENSYLFPQNIGAMLAYWDRDLICRYANIAYVDWFGVSPDSMINKMNMRDLLGNLYERNLPYIEGALKGENQIFEREIQTPNGERRYSLAHYYPEIENGQVLGFFVHVADTTSLKMAEEALVKYNGILKDQNERLMNFAFIVSHNLNSYSNNLTAVLKMYNNAKSDKQRNQMISFLVDIAEGFSSMINNLNEIVHAHHLTSIEHEFIDLYEYVEKITQGLSYQIQAANVTLINKIPVKTLIYTNPAFLESIIMNLFTNAIKYKHTDRKPEIIINYQNDPKYQMLVITDNGLGINLDKHGSDLFGLYKTFHGNTDGRGIGLFITRFQVESMGGKIEVDSKEDFGSSFKVYFVK